MTQLSDISIIPLRSAVLCGSCLAITNATGHLCPVCQSPSLYLLAAILDREEPVKKVPERDLGEYQHIKERKRA